MKLKRKAGLTAATLFLDVVTYMTLIRPRLISWGATKEETVKPLPGDGMLAGPRYKATHAVTIDAPPSDVWPWLAQIGQGRGGFYSYDWVENITGLDIHSATEIMPDLQDIKPGDHINLTPENGGGVFYLEVASIEPEKSLVLVAPGSAEECMEEGMPWGTWAFVLEDVGMGKTRLIARFRADFKPSLYGYMVNKYWLEPAHFLMERKMLLGIKQRAEQLGVTEQQMAAPGSDAGLAEAGPESAPAETETQMAS